MALPPSRAGAEAGLEAMQRRHEAEPPAGTSTPHTPGWAGRLKDACLDRWLPLRDRWLASPTFQRRASAFWPTRPIARRNARAVFDLVAGFVYSQVLVACVRLGLFDLLAAGPQTPAALAGRLGLPEPAVQRLLAAAASLRLLQARSGGRFGLGPLGAPLVGHGAIQSMVEHHGALYRDLADPVALLRHGRARQPDAEPAACGGAGPASAQTLAAYWPYAGAAQPASLPDERVAAYSALMSASQPLVADEVLDAYDFGRHRCLLDVGGGEGRFLVRVAERHPSLELRLFDLPAVAARAASRLAAAGLSARARCTGGSFLHDDLPGGADVVSLVRVIHDHDDDAALAILRAVHRTLPPGGAVVLAEPMAGTRGAEPVGDAYFGLYLWAMGSGRPRTSHALTAMLVEAGFGGVRRIGTRLPLQTSLLVACKPRAAA